MININIQLNKTQITIIDDLPNIVSGGVNNVQLNFTFSEDWAEFTTKQVIFYRDRHAPLMPVDIINNSCIVPADVIYDWGYFYFGVVGKLNDIIHTTEIIKIKVDEGAFSVETAPTPTPNIYQKIMQVFNSKLDKSLFDTKITELDDSIGSIETKLAELNIDQTYTPTSANAQSGKAVASAISGKLDKTTYNNYVSKIELRQFTQTTDLDFTISKLNGYVHNYTFGKIITGELNLKIDRLIKNIPTFVNFIFTPDFNGSSEYLINVTAVTNTSEILSVCDSLRSEIDKINSVFKDGVSTKLTLHRDNNGYWNVIEPCNIFNQNIQNLSDKVSELADMAIKYKDSDNVVTSWADVQRIVRAGMARDVFEVGEQLVCNHAKYGTMTWNIIGIDQENLSDTNYSHSMTLQLDKGISNNNLMLPFDSTGTSNVWESSTIRAWLNGEFFDNLDDDFKAVVAQTQKLTEGNQTADKVFLLSTDEVGRNAVELAYEFYQEDSFNRRNARGNYWLLRTPDSLATHIYMVMPTGNGFGNNLITKERKIIPACCIM